MRYPTNKKPEDWGWSIIDGRYDFYWFEGPESPTFQELQDSVNEDLNIVNEDNDEDTISNFSDDSSDEDSD
ncbi:hypothetical protein TKK_0010256 [Trichogramma kaykai]|uniref:Uncharacterized protein n=1 Tax=Trichogramma kaykai TaxID=54128 RepID=A0ABD2X075_9HYME